MPMPYSYRHASEEWSALLKNLREETLIASENVLYTCIQAVLISFRARLSVQQALDFADLLPAVLRAVFVSDWQVAWPLPWSGREEIRAEMRALRPDHNFCPPELLEHLLRAIPATTRQMDLERVLDRIGPEARAFWRL